MNVSFACPSCGVKGSTDAVHIGRQVRCKHCGYRFAIPDPESSEPDVYTLEESAAGAGTPRAAGPDAEGEGEAVFVPFQIRDPADRPRRKRRKAVRAGASQESRRARDAGLPGTAWLVRGWIALAVLLAAIALLAPQGAWLVGCVLMGLGGLMVLAGYLAGAYGAFSEDVLYGFLYLAIPPYTAYYLVTRWEDLRAWFVCETLGVGLVLLGTEMVRWAGAAA